MLIHEGLLNHPKVSRAGKFIERHCGSPNFTDGVSRALYLFLLGIAYSRQHLTDGFIPDTYLTHISHISDVELTARALSARGIRLWRKVRGGYRIHDYHRYNPTAIKEKARREQHRQYMAQYRKAKAS